LKEGEGRTEKGGGRREEGGGRSISLVGQLFLGEITIFLVSFSGSRRLVFFIEILLGDRGFSKLRTDDFSSEWESVLLANLQW
jgi:hypothetical protein